MPVVAALVLMFVCDLKRPFLVALSFLSKTHQVFHLWHVVHRPFSYSFAMLVCVHVGVAVSMGYF